MLKQNHPNASTEIHDKLFTPQSNFSIETLKKRKSPSDSHSRSVVSFIGVGSRAVARYWPKRAQPALKFLEPAVEILDLLVLFTFLSTVIHIKYVL